MRSAKWRRVRIRLTAPIRLTAAGTKDPDGQALTYRWWRYREAGSQRLGLELSTADGVETTAVVKPWTRTSMEALPARYPFHVILEVSDNGAPALTRYRRAVITVVAGGTVDGRPCPTPALRAPHVFTDEAALAALGTFSVTESNLGELLDNPEARGVLERRLPSLTKNPQVQQARGMTLVLLQAFMPELTDQALAAIDADLRKIKPR